MNTVVQNDDASVHGCTQAMFTAFALLMHLNHS